MKRLLILLVLPLLLFPKQEAERDLLFKQAVSAYASGDYRHALDIFHKIEAKGPVSWELYYNIANAYYRSDSLGRAIQYWEKAAMLAPSQKDVAYNLSIARDRLTDKVVLPEMYPLFRWYENLRKRIPLNLTITIIGYLLALLTLIQISCYVHKRLSGKRHRGLCWSSGITLGILIVFLGSVSIDTAIDRHQLREAVILPEEIRAYSEPDEKSARLFYLHEGSKVRILKEIEREWVQISYFDDKVGWIRYNHIGRIQQ